MTSAHEDLGRRGRSIMASACSLTLLITGRCNPQPFAVSPTDWPSSLGTTRSRDREIVGDGENVGKEKRENDGDNLTNGRNEGRNLKIEGNYYYYNYVDLFFVLFLGMESDGEEGKEQF